MKFIVLRLSGRVLSCLLNFSVSVHYSLHIMKLYKTFGLAGITIIVLLTGCPVQDPTGPLTLCSENPRYFTDGSGQAIYLTGSHTWPNLVDMGPDDPPEPFDFDAYLQWAKSYHHNFIRLWTWELVEWDTRANEKDTNEYKLLTVAPLRFARTGPGKALDGKPKFNLLQYNPEYFSRLRSRVEAAQEQNIYVSVMLFEGWGLQHLDNAWNNHPYNQDNNVNGINGDLDGDGKGLEIHTLSDTSILSIQKSYVRKVIETVNDLNNVMFEISNENHPPSKEWQYHMIDFIHKLERTMPKQHPVGMTFQYKGGSNQTLFESPADWISPNGEGGYKEDPPGGEGTKVIITDTDHLGGIWGNQQWVWKSFLRGLNPVFMDPYDCKVLKRSYNPEWVEPVRKSMGYTLDFARRMNLIEMVPENELSSSSYCLASRGKEYLVYLPDGNEVKIDLSDAPNEFAVEWFNPNTAETMHAEKIMGGIVKTMKSPFGEDDVVLYLKNIK